jgi:uncharacterized phage-like protein YoqJ
MLMAAHRNLSCCFTGHRAAKLPWGFLEEDARCVALKRHIFDTVEAVYASGIRHFICGMANGCDLYFCEAVLVLREERPEITLEAAVPFEGQAERWPPYQRRRYDRLLAECDEKTLIQKDYSSECMDRRNRYMVDHSSILVAAYDGLSGGTLNTLRYALAEGLEIIELPII